MQIQIPSPKPPIDQGATSQQTYVFPVHQPELWRVTALSASRYQPPSVGVRYHSPDQGATSQDTAPVPGITTRPDAWFGVTSAWVRDHARLLSGFVRSLEGATVQATSPIPPVSVPPDGWFRGASAAWLDARRMTGPRPQTDGATVQDLFQFFPAAPEFRWYVRNTQAPLFRPIEGPTLQQTFEFARPPAVRRDVALSQVPLPPLPIVQAPPLVSADVFPVSQPSSAWSLSRPRMAVVPMWDGATQQPSFIFVANQPEFAYQSPWRARLALTGPTPQLLGATITIAQSYTFPVNQPEPTWLRVPQRLRQVVDVTPQWSQGATVQGTVPVPPVSQPELLAYRLLQTWRFLVAAPLRFEGVQATYPVPAVSQPELTAFTKLQSARTLGGPIAQVAGAVTQPTSIFPVHQPSVAYYQALDVRRSGWHPEGIWIVPTVRPGELVARAVALRFRQSGWTFVRKAVAVSAPLERPRVMTSSVSAQRVDVTATIRRVLSVPEER